MKKITPLLLCCCGLMMNQSSALARHLMYKNAAVHSDGPARPQPGTLHSAPQKTPLTSPANAGATPTHILYLNKDEVHYFLQKNEAYTFSSRIGNSGASTVTRARLNYTINGGEVQTCVVDLNMHPRSVAHVMHTTAWTPKAAGAYTLKLWGNDLNPGNTKRSSDNDTLTAILQVLDSVQVKIPLVEEFNQASCDPCAQATPNVDSVLFNNLGKCSAVRYHVSWPGTDEMNAVTQNPFVNARCAYYNINSVPDAKIDGSTDVNPAGMGTSDIATAAAKGSPFRININYSYAPSTHTYSAGVNITAYSAEAAGLVAYCALTVDTLTYKGNQSSESIPQYVFPQVAEDMMPTSNGTTLAAFTVNQTRSLNLSWVQDHPWGADYSSWPYDSTTTHLVVWVEDSSQQYVYQSATVAPSSPLLASRTNPVLDNLYVYPNPSNGTTHLLFDLYTDATVSLEIVDMLGQQVSTTNEGRLGAGQHSLNFDSGTLSPGIYFVHMQAGPYGSTKKITVTR